MKLPFVVLQMLLALAVSTASGQHLEWVREVDRSIQLLGASGAGDIIALTWHPEGIYHSLFAADGAALHEAAPFEPPLGPRWELDQQIHYAILPDIGFVAHDSYSTTASCPEQTGDGEFSTCQEIFRVYDRYGNLHRSVSALVSSDTAYAVWALAGASDGSVAVSASLYGHVDFDFDGIADASAVEEAAPAVSRFGPDGTHIWTVALPDSFYAQISGLIFASDGGLYLSPVSKNRSDDFEFAVMRLDASGETQWSHTMVSIDFRRQVLATSDGGAFVTGTPRDSVAGEVPWSTSGYVITRFDANGEVIRQVVLRSSFCMHVSAVAIDSEDRLFVGGKAYGEIDLDDDGVPDISAETFHDPCSLESEMLLAGLEADGTLLFAATYGGYWIWPTAYHIEAADDGFLLGGFTTGPVDLNNDGHSDVERYGYFIARYRFAPPVDTERPEVFSSALSCAAYPNPASGPVTFRIESPRNARLRLELFDLLGRKVATVADTFAPAGTHEYAWSASGLAAGTYVYRATSDAETVTGTVVLTR